MIDGPVTLMAVAGLFCGSKICGLRQKALRLAGFVAVVLLSNHRTGQHGHVATSQLYREGPFFCRSFCDKLEPKYGGAYVYDRTIIWQH